MMMYSLFGLIPMIAMLLFVAVCIMTIVRAVVIPAEVRRGSRCGGCGYEIADLTTERCSECGAKLLRVGITTPAMIVRHRSSGLAAGLAWTALVGAVSMLSMTVVSISSMSSMNYQANQQINSTNSFTPRTRWNPQTQQMIGNDYSLAFAVDVVIDEYGIVESGEIELEFTNASDQTVVAVIDPLTLLYTLDGNTELEDGTFDADAAAAVLESLGYDAESESIQNESSQIEAMVFEVPNDPQNFENILWSTSSLGQQSLQSGGGSSSAMPVGGMGGLFAGAGLAIGLMVFWLVVWATGLALMTWRRKRLFNVM